MRIDVAALLCDIDGTLVASIDTIEHVWRAWADTRGLDAQAIIDVCHGRRSEDTIAEFLPEAEVPSAVVELEALEHAYAGNAVGLPGTQEVLAQLAAEPRPRWAVVTSGSRAVMEPRLIVAGLPVPDVFVAAEDVARGKPDPAGYRQAARALGVEPGDCLVLEDAPAGVAAGVAAGAAVLAVATSHEASALRAAAASVLAGTPGAGAFTVVTDLSECSFVCDPDRITVEIS